MGSGEGPHLQGEAFHVATGSPEIQDEDHDNFHNVKSENDDEDDDLLLGTREEQEDDRLSPREGQDRETVREASRDPASLGGDKACYVQFKCVQ